MALPALGAALAVGVPALGSLIGGERANRKNLQIAREQMAFQERMSSTAYQRSMDDMRKAGLNPMLAFQQGSASTPGGASATMQNVAEPAVSTSMAMTRMREDLKRVKAETSRISDQEWSQVQDRAESRAREDNYVRQSDVAKVQSEILKLQLPALKNSAKVERSKVGENAALLDRLRQVLLGGRGFFNPVN